jgi:hypothetical protein
MANARIKYRIISALASRLIAVELSSAELKSIAGHFACMQVVDRTAVYFMLFVALLACSLGCGRTRIFRIPFISAFVGLISLHREASRQCMT